MGHQDKDSGILCIGHGQNSLFGPTMATLILLHRKIWLSWANWLGKRGIPFFTHSHEGEKVTVHSTPKSPHHCHPPSFIRPILDPSATWSHTKYWSYRQNYAYFLSCQLRKEVLLPSLDSCYLTMLLWSLNNLPCCSSTIGPCLQSAKSEIG